LPARQVSRALRIQLVAVSVHALRQAARFGSMLNSRARHSEVQLLRCDSQPAALTQA
jgi:hypothetical protein